MALLRSLLVSLEANSAKLVTEMQKATNAIDKVKQSLTTIKLDALTSLGERALRVGQQLNQMAQEGAAILQIELTFQRLSASIGLSADQILADMMRVTKGMMDDTEMMRGATQAMLEGFSPDEINQMLEASRAAVLRTGMSMEEAFTGVLNAITNLQTRGLKSLFGADVSTRFSEYENSMKNLGYEVDETAKKHWMLAQVVQESSQVFQQLGGDAENAATKFKQLQTDIDNMLDNVKKGALSFGLAFAGIFTEVRAAFSGVVAFIAGDFARLMNLLSKVPGPTKATFESLRDDFITVGTAYEESMFSLDEQAKRFLESAADTWGKLPDAAKKATTETTSVLDDFYGRLQKGPSTEAPPWIKQWVAGFEPLKDAFKGLGIESTENLMNQAKQAQTYVGWIRQAFQQGKASINDYYNALVKAKEAMQKLTAKDTTDELIKNELEYQKAVREIDIDDPDRQKKVQALIDTWIEARQKIEAQGPISMFDVSKAESELKALEAKLPELQLKIGLDPESEKFDVIISEYDKVKGQIESMPIKLDADISQAISAIQELRAEAARGITIAIKGSASPVKPFMETLADIMAGTSEWSDKMNSINAIINFASLASQMDELTGRITAYKQNLAHMASWAGGATMGRDPYYDIMLNELTPKIELLQIQMMGQMMQAFGENWQEAMGDMDFSKWIGMQSYHTGGYVRKSGLAMVHEGEQVVGKSDFNMGNISINVPRGTTQHQAKSLAKELARVIKYRRSSDLRKALK